MTLVPEPEAALKLPLIVEPTTNEGGDEAERLGPGNVDVDVNGSSCPASPGPRAAAAAAGAVLAEAGAVLEEAGAVFEEAGTVLCRCARSVQ